MNNNDSDVVHYVEIPLPVLSGSLVPQGKEQDGVLYLNIDEEDPIEKETFANLLDEAGKRGNNLIIAVFSTHKQADHKMLLQNVWCFREARALSRYLFGNDLDKGNNNTLYTDPVSRQPIFGPIFYFVLEKKAESIVECTYRGSHADLFNPDNNDREALRQILLPVQQAAITINEQEIREHNALVTELRAAVPHAPVRHDRDNRNDDQPGAHRLSDLRDIEKIRCFTRCGFGFTLLKTGTAVVASAMGAILIPNDKVVCDSFNRDPLFASGNYTVMSGSDDLTIAAYYSPGAIVLTSSFLCLASHGIMKIVVWYSKRTPELC